MYITRKTYTAVTKPPIKEAPQVLSYFVGRPAGIVMVVDMAKMSRSATQGEGKPIVSGCLHIIARSVGISQTHYIFPKDLGIDSESLAHMSVSSRPRRWQRQQVNKSSAPE